MPRPTTNFIWLWSKSFCSLLLWKGKNPFQSASDCTNTIMKNNLISLFGFCFFCVSDCMCIAQDGMRIIYPSPACAITTTINGWRSWVEFSFFFFRKRISMFMCLLSTPHSAHFSFPSYELWQEIFYASSTSFQTSELTIREENKLSQILTWTKFYFVAKV